MATLHRPARNSGSVAHRRGAAVALATTFLAVLTLALPLGGECLQAESIHPVDLAGVRNRLGLRTSFLEDPLEGMLAARAGVGRTAAPKQAAAEQQKEEAKKLAEKVGEREAIKSFLGPRGGVPTLKANLLKLAALLRVEVASGTQGIQWTS